MTGPLKDSLTRRGRQARCLRTYAIQGDLALAGMVTSTNCMSMLADDSLLPFGDKGSRICRLNELISTYKGLLQL